MGIYPARRVHADHLRQEGIILRDQVFGYAPCPQNLLAMIDVMQKGVQRLDTLFDPAREGAPFMRANNPRQEIEGDQALLGFRIAIDIERDAGAAEKVLRLLRLVLEACRIHAS